MRKSELDTLKYIIKETLWMARRYAHGRRTFAASTLNECVDLALKLGIDIKADDVVGGMYADDADLGKWMPEHQTFKWSLEQAFPRDKAKHEKS
jgi:hypothetical protein